VIDALEDAEDYAAFEMAVAADHDAQSAVERELVLRLASLLWRLRRATGIESGLFKIQAKHLLQFRRRREAHEEGKVIDNRCQFAIVSQDDTLQKKDWASANLDRAHHLTLTLLTKWTISHDPLWASPTCQPIPSMA
jgi:hypothetical protein